MCDVDRFAAEIFCSLHDELMALASRGHDLDMRVQQLEDELPAVEKALLSEPNQLRFAYTNGALTFFFCTSKKREIYELSLFTSFHEVKWFCLSCQWSSKQSLITLTSQVLIGMQAYAAIKTTVHRVIYHALSATITKNAEGLLSFSFLTSASIFQLLQFFIVVYSLQLYRVMGSAIIYDDRYMWC